jgi:ribonuclease VapC
MPHKSKAVVLDSWSIIAYLEDEPAGQQVADIIADAHEDGIPVMMTVVNAGEVWYLLARETSASEADSGLLDMRQLGVDLVEADWKLAHEAAMFKSKHKMSFADCFSAALAKQKNADLVTGDHEFKQVEGTVKILWVH